MDTINCFQLTKETIIQELKQREFPLSFENEDVRTGTNLFVEIILDSFEECAKGLNENSFSFLSKEEMPYEKVAQKIHGLVTQSAVWFYKAVQSGFPFSILEKEIGKKTLEKALNEPFPSILTHFLFVNPNWLDEPALNELIGPTLKKLQAKEIIHACVSLQHAFERQGDLKAGYYLLWLIKQAGNCSYSIPEKTEFTKESVKDILCAYLKNFNVPLNEAIGVLQILCYRPSVCLELFFERFLGKEAWGDIYSISLKALLLSPWKEWPEKGELIVDFLNIQTLKGKYFLCEALAKSPDSETSKVGQLILSALNAKSLTEALPHFYELKDKQFLKDCSDFECIFEKPFPVFSKPWRKLDSEFAKELFFKAYPEPIICDQFIIGIYQASHGKCPSLYLLAYEMISNKLIWGIPLASKTTETIWPRECRLMNAGQNIALYLLEESSIQFINKKTGELNFILECPKPFNDVDEFHISSNGLMYQKVTVDFIHETSLKELDKEFDEFHSGSEEFNEISSGRLPNCEIKKEKERVLFGGKLMGNKWQHSFELKTPGGLFLPLSTHCGFYDLFRKKPMTLIGPTGDQKIIVVQEAVAEKDKLYTIEKDPEQDGFYFLKIRILKDDSSVISEVEKTIHFCADAPSFRKVCQEGKLMVLFSGYQSEGQKIIFVDLINDTVIYSNHQIPPHTKYIIDPHSGIVWTSVLDTSENKICKHIYKISQQGVEAKDKIQGELLHVNQDGQIYFIDD